MLIFVSVCFVIKAIHLEIVEDLTIAAFLAAFRRFCGRRGVPAELHSDNATTFIGANRELEKLYDFLHKNDNTIKEMLATEKIKWQFIPPHSPYQGGLWEAAVKSFKYHLCRVVGNSVLSFMEMQT